MLCNFIILTKIWKSRSAAALQGEGIFYAVGKTASSLLVIPFLSSGNSVSNSTKTRTFMNSTKLLFAFEDNGSTHIHHYSLESDNTSFTFETNGRMNASASPYGTRVQWVFVINSLLYLVTAILAFILFWRIVKCDYRHVMVLSTDLQSEYRLAKTSSTLQQKRKMKLMTIMFYIFTFLFCFFLTSLQLGYPAFLLTFTNKYLGWDKESGVWLTTAFDAGGVALSIIYIFVSSFVPNSSLLITVNISVMVAAAGILLFLHSQHYMVIWIATIAIGTSAHPVIGLFASYASHILPLSGRYQTMIWTGPCLSGLCFPAIVAYLMENVSGLWFIYLTAINSLFTIVTYIVLRICGRQIVRIQKETTDVLDS